MNDRFKFRYYNKYANKMVKPENWQNVDGIYECIKQQVCFDEDIAPLPYDHIGNGLVFMQCTGLKDKNGKLIYEGDIVKGKDHFNRDRLCEITYSSIYCCFFIIGDKWSDEYLFNLNDKEVIGNIYENPELIERI